MSNASTTGWGATRRLTPTERKIIAFVAGHENEPCSKGQMAQAVGCSQKTIDRLVARLREEGLLVSTYAWGASGAQLANSYRLARNQVSEASGEPRT